MAVSYWAMVAENVAKGLGKNTIKKLGTSGKFLGRAGGVIGVGFLVYELFKNYKDNIENEPAFQEMVILQEEVRKWGNAISCLGRKPFEDEGYGGLEEGGAINALYPKKLFDGKGVKPADIEEAATLVESAIEYILDTENVSEDVKFEDKRDALVSRLKQLKKQINQVSDYGPIQEEITGIVDEIRPIESGYSARVYECSREIQKQLGSNAAWAAISMATLGLIKKPGK